MKGYYPFRNCEYEIMEDLVILITKNPKPSFFEKLFFKNFLNKPVKIDLDEIGSYIWSLCDGSICIEMIVEKSIDKFGERIKPAEDRVVKYLEQMNKAGFIKLFEKR